MRPGGGKQKGSAFEREIAAFWARVKRGNPGECWLWLMGTDSNGYGTLVFDGKQDRAHRVAWRIGRNRKPGRWRIRHRCDTPGCCNPSHLFRGTQKQNIQEASRRGRMVRSHAPNPLVQGESNGHAKLTEARVRWARRNSGKIPLSVMCKKLGVTLGTISPAINGKTWRHVK